MTVHLVAAPPASSAARPHSASQPEEGFAGRRAMLPVVLVALFMAQFDLYVANVALPTMQADLHATGSQLQLVIGGYAFTYAAGLITSGRLGDVWGHRCMFIAGMATFGLASLVCGLAPSAE